MKKENTKKTPVKPRTKTTITPEIIEKVEELAKKGLNNIMIAQSLGMEVTTLSRNSKLKQAIQNGKLELALEVSQTILDTLYDDNSMKALLVKRLGLFNKTIDIKKPNNAKDAISNLSDATKQYSEGFISESQLRTIQAVSNSYIKAHDSITLEERLTKIEEMIKEKHEK